MDTFSFPFSMQELTNDMDLKTLSDVVFSNSFPDKFVTISSALLYILANQWIYWTNEHSGEWASVQICGVD